jgi:hypothetical protein
MDNPGRRAYIVRGVVAVLSRSTQMSSTLAVDETIVRRARAEYLEMPGLRLTSAQAQRLWGLDRRTCEELLATLASAHFLARTRDGAFILSSSRV